MSATVQSYWDEVKEARKEILASVMQQKEQFKDGRNCFIVSKRNRKDSPDVRAGVVTECSIHIAGQRIIDQVAELASDQAIVQWRQEQASAKKEIARLEAVRKSQFLAEPAR
jgi:hypothetical protein